MGCLKRGRSFRIASASGTSSRGSTRDRGESDQVRRSGTLVGNSGQEHALKLDRSFVADLATSSDSRAITQCIVDLANNMELESIAEGVETEEIATMLENMGVDFLQGYVIARSMPANQLPDWLQQWKARAASDIQPPTCIIADSGVGPHDEADAECAAPIAAASGSTAWDDTRPQVAANPPRLTPRQATVLQLLAEGYSVKAMARRLNLGVGTVKTHLSQVYIVLGAHNRVEALRRAGMMVVQPEQQATLPPR